MTVLTRLEIPRPRILIELTDGQITYFELSADLFRATAHDARGFAERVLPVLRHALRLHADEVLRQLSADADGPDERFCLAFLKESLPQLSEEQLRQAPAEGTMITVEGELMTLHLREGLPVALDLDDYTVRPEARLEVEQELRATLERGIALDAQNLEGALHGSGFGAEPPDWASLAERIAHHQRTEYR